MKDVKLEETITFPHNKDKFPFIVIYRRVGSQEVKEEILSKAQS